MNYHFNINNLTFKHMYQIEILTEHAHYIVGVEKHNEVLTSIISGKHYVHILN